MVTLPTSSSSRKTTGNGRYDQLKKGGVADYTDFAYKEAVGKLKSMLNDTYNPSPSRYHHNHNKGDDSDDENGLSFTLSDTTRVAKLGAYRRPFSKSYLAPKMSPPVQEPTPLPATAAPPELLSFIERQEEYIEQLEKESQYCRDELSQLLGKVKDLISENESLHAQQKSADFKNSNLIDEIRPDYKNLTCACKCKPHLEGPTIVFESRISELEAQLTQVRMDLKKSQEEAIIYKRKLMENDPTSSSSEFYRQIETLHREKRDLSEAINKLQSAVAQLREKESDSTRKVLRTQDVAEKAQMDKQQAEMEVQRLKSELDHQHQRLLDVLSEQTRKVAEERSQAERRYLQHVEQLSAELTMQRDAAAKVQLELERHLRIEDDLRRDLAAKNITADNVRKELNGKIASLQSELATALIERDGLEQELSTNKMSGERSERSIRQDASRLQVEVNALRQRIERNESELIQARRENLRLAEQISMQENEITIYKSKVGEIEEGGGAQRASTVRELESVVQRQSQMMTVLTQQCHSLTQKLEDASAHHKQEMEELQGRLEFLTSRLDTSIASRQWSDEKYQPPEEQYQSNYEPDPMTYPSPYLAPEEPSQPNVFIDESHRDTDDKPILSRVNSHGEKMESPLSRQESRKNPLARKESRMQIQSSEYPPPQQQHLQQLPKQQPQMASFAVEEVQQQRGGYLPENNYQNSPEYVTDTTPYEPDLGSYEPEQPVQYSEPYEQQPYDNTSYYPSEEPTHYSPAGPEPHEEPSRTALNVQNSESYKQDRTPSRENYQDYKPEPILPRMSSSGESAGSGSSYNKQSDPYYKQGSPELQRQKNSEPYKQDRAPSRESLRNPYQENLQDFQPKMSSSGESAGVSYKQPDPYQQSSPELQKQPATTYSSEPQKRDLPKQNSRPQIASSNESLSGSEMKSQDVNYETSRPKLTPQGSTVRRDSKRNTPTKLQ